MGVAETWVLVVVVDPARLAVGIVQSTTGEVVVRDRIATPSREVWRSLDQLIRRVLAASPPDGPAPASVAVSCVGPIDATAGSVSPELLPSWSAFPLRERLAELTGLPVYLDTTAGALVAGEQRFGDLRDTPTFCALVLDQTIESACVSNRVRLRGAHGNAGSLAHMCVDPAGPRCACGAPGCLSVFASAAALETEMNRPLRRATPSIIERTGMMVGRAIASAAAVYDISTFVLSGSVVDTFGDPMLDVLRRELSQRSRLDHLAGLQVLEASGFLNPLVATAAVSEFTGGPE